MWKTDCIAAAVLAAWALAPLAAQVGELDTTFSGDGRVTYAPAGVSAIPFAVAGDDAGRIVVTGYVRDVANSYDMEVLRYQKNGALDATFGVGGIRQIAFDLEGAGFEYPTALWLDSSQRILVHGLAQNDPADSLRRTPVLARLTSAGNLDPTFSGDGKLALFLPQNGYSYGSSSTAILPAGGGAFWVEGWCTACAADGRNRIYLTRVLANGTQDPTFGDDGWFLFEPPAPVVTGSWFLADWFATADGRLFAAVGNLTGDLGLVRFTAAGALDTSWGPGGWRVFALGDQGNGDYLDYPTAFTVDGAGRPVVVWQAVAGLDHRFVRVFRFTVDGALDASFGTGGAATLDLSGSLGITTAAAMGDRILLSGSGEPVFQSEAADMFCARLEPDGDLDPTFGGNGMTFVAFDIPGVPTHDFGDALALVGGRAVLVGTAWEMPIDGPEAPAGTTNGTRWAIARLQESWIFADGFDQGGALGWSAVAP